MPDASSPEPELRELALRVIPLHGKTGLNLGAENRGKVDHKNEDISKSVCSIDRGPIFQTSAGHDLSRNVVVVSVYAL